MIHEWRRAEKEFYLPGKKPEYIIIPPFKFFSVRGRGNPNDASFSDYITVLYSLSYAIKMAPKSGMAPVNYFEYAVYPLEGVWDISEEAKNNPPDKFDKKNLVFNLMIRQPDFVKAEYASEVIQRTKIKKPHHLLDSVIFGSAEEGCCIQMLHIGSYDDEPLSFRTMEDFCESRRLKRESGAHREIYLSDARKVSKEKLKTILRFKISES